MAKRADPLDSISIPDEQAPSVEVAKIQEPEPPPPAPAAAEAEDVKPPVDTSNFFVSKKFRVLKGGPEKINYRAQTVNLPVGKVIDEAHFAPGYVQHLLDYGVQLEQIR